jgi:hypothetical protein
MTRGSSRRRREWSTRSVATAVAGVIGALAALVSIVAWLQGQFKSHPKPPPPKVADAQILNPRVLRMHDRLGDYLSATGQSKKGLSRADLDEQGIRTTVRVRFQGKLNQKLPLRWSMLRADGSRLRGPVYNQQAIVFTVEHESDARTVPVWTPYPPRPGDYRVDFLVADPSGKPLDEEATPVFHVDRVPEV